MAGTAGCESPAAASQLARSPRRHHILRTGLARHHERPDQRHRRERERQRRQLWTQDRIHHRKFVRCTITAGRLIPDVEYCD